MCCSLGAAHRRSDRAGCDGRCTSCRWPSPPAADAGSQPGSPAERSTPCRRTDPHSRVDEHRPHHRTDQRRGTPRRRSGDGSSRCSCGRATRRAASGPPRSGARRRLSSRGRDEPFEAALRGARKHSDGTHTGTLRLLEVALRRGQPRSSRCSVTTVPASSMQSPVSSNRTVGTGSTVRWHGWWEVRRHRAGQRCRPGSRRVATRSSARPRWCATSQRRSRRCRTRPDRAALRAAPRRPRSTRSSAFRLQRWPWFQPALRNSPATPSTLRCPEIHCSRPRSRLRSLGRLASMFAARAGGILGGRIMVDIELED